MVCMSRTCWASLQTVTQPGGLRARLCLLFWCARLPPATLARPILLRAASRALAASKPSPPVTRPPVQLQDTRMRLEAPINSPPRRPPARLHARLLKSGTQRLFSTPLRPLGDAGPAEGAVPYPAPFALGSR